jgi:hypothetical protein
MQMRDDLELRSKFPFRGNEETEMDESILGIIPNASKKKGWIKRQSWNLVFTNRRMIGALVTDEMVKAEAASATQAAQAQGAGVLKRMWSTATAGFTLHKKYLTMMADQILAENPENFAVELPQIQSVKASAGWPSVTNQNQTNQNPDTLTIRTTDEKMEFQLALGSVSAREAVTILRPILGDRVR